MDREGWVTQLADQRSVMTNAANPDSLSRVMATWPEASELPRSADRLWRRAREQFRSGPVAYENFTDAVRTAFEAVDAALRAHISDLINPGERLTFGRLIQRANDEGRLAPTQYTWLSDYALRFRNRLTHADGEDPLVLSPAMAADMMGGVGRFLAELTRTPPRGK